MASIGAALEIEGATQVLQGMENECWYALQTKARHEKVVQERLQGRGVETFLPMVTEIHHWSDRKKKVELPLFSCYLFARLAPTKMDRLRILCVEGVFRFVGHGNAGLPIPDEQIEAVRALVDSQLPYSSHPFFKVGQKVRICSGSLQGVQGILVSQNGDETVVISVDAIQRSLAVKVQGYKLQAA
jgi:transcription antitermination factor NusG